MSIKELEIRLSNLEKAFIESQNRNIENTNKAEMSLGNVSDITPTTYIKKAYIGDSEVVFDNVVNGNVSVYAETESGKIISTITDRIDKSIRVSFDTLEEVATVTISIL